MRRIAIVTATAAAGVALLPAVASAHPAFNPSALPPGETVASTLVIPHGCAPGGGMPDMDEDGDAAEPTTELALQHIDRVTVEPEDVAGWQISDDGEAWVWSDDGGATTDVIELPVMLTIDASVTPGDELHLRAYQECADGSSFQWVGTPDDEARFPAVLLTASDGGVGTAEPDESMTMDHGDMDMGGDGATEDDMAMDQGDGPTAADTEAVAGDTSIETEQAAAEGGLSPLLLGLLVAVLLAVAAGVVLRGRRG